MEYLVHWSGFNKEDHIWKLEGQLDNAKDIIIDFQQANPSTPQKLQMSYIDFLGLFKPYENYTVIHNKNAPVTGIWDPPTFFPYSILPTIPLPMGHDNQ